MRGRYSKTCYPRTMTRDYLQVIGSSAYGCVVESSCLTELLDFDGWSSAYDQNLATFRTTFQGNEIDQE